MTIPLRRTVDYHDWNPLIPPINSVFEYPNEGGHVLLLIITEACPFGQHERISRPSRRRAIRYLPYLKWPCRIGATRRLRK